MKLQVHILGATMHATVTCTACGETFFDANNGHSSDTFSHTECKCSIAGIKLRCQNPSCKKEYLLVAIEDGFQLEKP